MDFNDPLDFYDSWDNYEETAQEHANPRGSRADFGAFLPSPNDIKQRCLDMRWLENTFGPEDDLLDSIMIFDTPTIEEVRSHVRTEGVWKTHDYIHERMKARNGC